MKITCNYDVPTLDGILLSVLGSLYSRIPKLNIYLGETSIVVSLLQANYNRPSNNEETDSLKDEIKP